MSLVVLVIGLSVISIRLILVVVRWCRCLMCVLRLIVLLVVS